MKEVNELIKELTLEEKIALVSGTNFMYTYPIDRLTIPSIRMSDGPHGLRVQKEGASDNGTSGSEIATCFPPACLSSCSWNKDLIYEVGKAMGEEALYYGIDVILGPGNNIKRNPLGGRNFEYFSEDPLLSGVMAGNMIKGIQEKGISVSLKHFACNNQENYRFMGDSIVDTRALREIYLKAFEIAVKVGHPDTIMCSYNKINGVYVSESKMLLNDILRNEWGFNGLIMTDWGASHNRVNMLKSSLDLEMPGDTSICRKWIYEAIKDKTLEENVLDNAVKNVLNLVYNHSEKKEEQKENFASHSSLSLKMALDSAVLLKNENNVLPLKKEEKYLVIGDLFSHMRYQGSGSSLINPYLLITPQQAFDEAGVNYTYLKGYKENEDLPNEELLKEVSSSLDNYDTILAFIGLTDYVESEGADRETFSLPNNQIELIKRIVNKNKKVILVLFGGSPFEIPCLNEVNGILNMYLPGQEGGRAVYKLLFGEVSPSGKLSETWPLTYNDVSSSKNYSKERIELYKESIFVGYRYYEKIHKDVTFNFGYGLSYTKFKYSDMKIEESENEIDVRCLVTNIGPYKGSEIVQLYVKGVDSNIPKPIKELKGFNKVYLDKNETKEVHIKVNKDDLRYFNIKENRFILEDGEYEFMLSSSLDKVELKETLYLKGETKEDIYPYDVLSLTDDQFFSLVNISKPEIKKKPITLESRFSDLKETFWGRRISKCAMLIPSMMKKKASKMEEGKEKDNKIKNAIFLEKMIFSISFNGMSMSAGTKFPYNKAEGIVLIANGHLFKGLKKMCSKIKAPILPKDNK